MKLLVLDGNSLLNRAFYGIKQLTNRAGEPTNAVFGFMNILRKLETDNNPDAVAVAFDLPAPTFRHKLYDGYKATRKGMPDDLAAQLAPTKALLDALGYTRVERAGFEADDILGTLAAAARARGDECVLATGDRDSFQLIGGGVTVQYATVSPAKDADRFDEAAIAEKYGVTPRQLIEVKALMGDASDNIPGVAGVGEKTALALIAQYGDVAGVYAHLDDGEIKAGVREKLRAGRANADLSRELAEICCDAPIETGLASYARKPGDPAAAYRLLQRLELFRLMKTLGLEEPPEGVETAPASTEAPCTAETCSFADLARFDTVDLVFDGEMLTAGHADAERRIRYAASASLAWDTASVEPLLALELRTDDAKALTHLAAEHGLPAPRVTMDVSLAGYLLNPNATDYSLAALFTSYQIQSAPEGDAGRMARFDALCAELERRLEDTGMAALLRDIELPLASVLADMERDGFAVDRDGIAAFGKELDVGIKELTDSIYAGAGQEFNINSPKQLGEVLFGESGLGLPYKGKKSKTGWSTNVDVLDAIRGADPIVGQILEYRKLTKLKNTYVEGLTKEIEADGRIRSVFNQKEARTGRISSKEPNLQNIPVRTELGREMRRFFVAREGWTLLDADYSQIELRVLASIADDKRMIEAFRSGRDFHTATAAEVFGLPEDMVTSQLRSRAKAVNFGIVYGISAFSLANDIGVGFDEAKRYIERYLSTYSGVDAYMKRMVKQANEQGWVSTAFGRRRPLPELRSSNANLRSFGERVAMNTPIQGTAADIIKIAMIRVHDRLAAEGLRARLILQVHDELLVEAPLDEADRAAEILKYEMEHAVELTVPMYVDVHSGKDWFTAKG